MTQAEQDAKWEAAIKQAIAWLNAAEQAEMQGGGRVDQQKLMRDAFAPLRARNALLESVTDAAHALFVSGWDNIPAHRKLIDAIQVVHALDAQDGAKGEQG